MNEDSNITEENIDISSPNSTPEKSSILPIIIIIIIIIAGGWYVLIENRPKHSSLESVNDQVSNEKANELFEKEAVTISDQLSEVDKDIESLEKELEELDELDPSF